MNKQRRILPVTLTVLACVLGTGLSTRLLADPASTAPHHELRLQHRLDGITQHLQLTDEQRTQVEALMKDQAAKKNALQASFRLQLESILTEEQAEKFRARKDCRGPHGRRGEGPGHQRSGPVSDQDAVNESL